MRGHFDRKATPRASVQRTDWPSAAPRQGLLTFTHFPVFLLHVCQYLQVGASALFSLHSWLALSQYQLPSHLFLLCFLQCALVLHSHCRAFHSPRQTPLALQRSPLVQLLPSSQCLPFDAFLKRHFPVLGSQPFLRQATSLAEGHVTFVAGLSLHLPFFLSQ